MMLIKRIFAVLLLIGALNACNGESSVSNSVANAPIPPDSASTDPINPKPDTTPDVPPPDTTPGYTKAVLLFNGTGVSTSDWQATEGILQSQGLSYDLINSAQLNAMSLSTMTSYGMIIIPGGSGGTITSNLTTDTRLRVRQAVREYGLGYVGFCAGAWVAVAPEAETGQVASYGIGIAKGAILDLFLPGGMNPTAAMVPVLLPNSSSARSLVWWGGPITPSWSNGVVARYQETGEPAISQTFAGKGLVIVTGPHPEAPQGWRATAGYDADGLDYDLAAELIQAALNKKPLLTF